MEIDRDNLGTSVNLLIRGCIAITIMMTVVVLTSAGTYFWDGHLSSHLTYERLIEELHGKNPEAAAERLRQKILIGIMELQKITTREDWDGIVAKNALEQFRAQLAK